ncbi:hypothetical protein HY634_02090, partial [Candidatus Uhrbacteria bacterium]|nr:hypothetical protein [Candidatus Uhrbacteria bacterium]
LDILLDPDAALAESDEANNHATLAASKLTVLTNKRPTADAGEDITERDDDGDGKEVTRFYSRNSKDPDGKIVKWAWTVAGREVATGQYPYWRNVPVGVHEVTLTVTDDGGLTAMDTVRVTVQPKPATQPDLALDAFTMTPTQPKPGDVVTFTARVVNRSTISVGTVSTVSFDIWTDGKYRTQLARPVVRDLAPGKSQEFQWNDPKDRSYHWKPQVGSHRIIVCADNSQLIAESNEQNNCSTVNVVVRAPEPPAPKEPDLIVEKVSFTPARPEPGDVLTVIAVVRNVGKASASASVAWFTPNASGDDDVSAIPTPQDVPTLAPGARATVTWEEAWVAETGSETFEVCADAEETVMESNEANNCRSVKMIVSARSLLQRVAEFPLRIVLDVFSTPIHAGTE